MSVDILQDHPSRLRTLVSSPVPSISLSRVHVADALRRSQDNGATLDFARQSITDVGESGVQGLATLGREHLDEDDSSVLRSVPSQVHLTQTSKP